MGGSADRAPLTIAQAPDTAIPPGAGQSRKGGVTRLQERVSLGAGLGSGESQTSARKTGCVHFSSTDSHPPAADAHIMPTARDAANNTVGPPGADLTLPQLTPSPTHTVTTTTSQPDQSAPQNSSPDIQMDSDAPAACNGETTNVPAPQANPHTVPGDIQDWAAISPQHGKLTLLSICYLSY
jgi:hypothetical protein